MDYRRIVNHVVVGVAVAVLVGVACSGMAGEPALPVTFEEGMDGVILQTLRNWFNAWLNEKDGSSQGESAVKVDAIIRLLDHQNQVVAQGHIFGFFVENMPDAPLSYEADGLLQIQASFGYDYWDLE